MAQTNENIGIALSNGLAEAVARAGRATVLVNARRRRPASGVGFASDTVLTADHVIEREDEIGIILADGSERSAILIGRDASSDLALLKVKNGNLNVAERAGYEAKVGQLALALGRPSTEGIQASLGVVSAIGGPLRTGRGSLLEQYLRTDTIPYPGFSGGPLVDAAGFVLGINTSGLWRGGSLTIPAGLAWSIASALAENGRIKRGYLGIRSQPAAISAGQRIALGREQANGLLVVGVEENSPAEKGGLLVGDILVGLAGEPISDPDALAARLIGSVVDQEVEVEILRGGQPTNLKVIIGERR